MPTPPGLACCSGPEHSWGLHPLLDAMPATSTAFWPVNGPVTYLLGRPWAALPAEALIWGNPRRAAERFAADLYSSPAMHVLACVIGTYVRQVIAELTKSCKPLCWHVRPSRK